MGWDPIMNPYIDIKYNFDKEYKYFVYKYKNSWVRSNTSDFGDHCTTNYTMFLFICK